MVLSSMLPEILARLGGEVTKPARAKHNELILSHILSQNWDFKPKLGLFGTKSESEIKFIMGCLPALMTIGINEVNIFQMGPNAGARTHY